jgi:hypothetical protein
MVSEGFMKYQMIILPCLMCLLFAVNEVNAEDATGIKPISHAIIFNKIIDKANRANDKLEITFDGEKCDGMDGMFKMVANSKTINSGDTVSIRLSGDLKIGRLEEPPWFDTGLIQHLVKRGAKIEYFDVEGKKLRYSVLSWTGYDSPDYSKPVREQKTANMQLDGIPISAESIYDVIEKRIKGVDCIQVIVPWGDAPSVPMFKTLYLPFDLKKLMDLAAKGGVRLEIVRNRYEK